MNPYYNKIFTTSLCLTHNKMIEYLHGTLSEQEKHKIETHIVDCEMCNDAIEGLSNMNNVSDLPLIINSFDNAVDSYINKEKNITADYTIRSKKTNIRRVLSIAASVALLVTVGFVINNFSEKSSDNLAQTEVTHEAFLEESGSVNETEKIDAVEVSENEKSISEDVYENFTARNDETLETDTEQIPSVEKNKTESSVSVADEDVGYENNEELADVETEIVVTEPIKSEGAAISYSGKEKKELSEKSIKETDVVSDKNDRKTIFGFTSRGISSENNKKTKSSAGMNYLSMRNSGLLSYDVKSYKEAATDFDNYLKYKPEDYEIVYKSGMSHYHLQNYSTATAQYNKIINGDINKYVEDAQWHKSVILIKQGKNDEALNLLNQIVFKNGKYQKRALETINQLENNQ